MIKNLNQPQKLNSIQEYINNFFDSDFENDNANQEEDMSNINLNEVSN